MSNDTTLPSSTKEEKSSNLIPLTPEQRAVVSLYDQQMSRFHSQYIPVARKVGELTEQLEFAKQEEQRIRSQLSKVEVERTEALNKAAKELGHSTGQNWRYLYNQFAFEKIDDSNQ